MIVMFLLTTITPAVADSLELFTTNVPPVRANTSPSLAFATRSTISSVGRTRVAPLRSTIVVNVLLPRSFNTPFEL